MKQKPRIVLALRARPKPVRPTGTPGAVEFPTDGSRGRTGVTGPTRGHRVMCPCRSCRGMVLVHGGDQ